MFDHLLLIANGSVAYSGLAAHAVRYFGNLGIPSSDTSVAYPGDSSGVILQPVHSAACQSKMCYIPHTSPVL